LEEQLFSPNFIFEKKKLFQLTNSFQLKKYFQTILIFFKKNFTECCFFVTDANKVFRIEVHK